MSQPGRISEQLNIPLVWEGEETGPPPLPRQKDLLPRPRGAGGRRRGRLLFAALADAGVMLLCCGVTGAVAVLVGAELNTLQLVLAAAAGGSIYGAASVLVLWAWRGTMGMLLLGLGFVSPLRFSRAVAVSALWAACLPLAGIPLMLGQTGFEGLAQAQLTGR